MPSRDISCGKKSNSSKKIFETCRHHCQMLTINRLQPMLVFIIFLQNLIVIIIYITQILNRVFMLLKIHNNLHLFLSQQQLYQGREMPEHCLLLFPPCRKIRQQQIM